MTEAHAETTVFTDPQAPDWDAISEEVVAAREEGIAPMPEDVIAIRDEVVSLAAQIDILNSRREELKKTVAARLEDEGLVGYILHGKVRARVKHGDRVTVDSKKLRDTLPHIWAQFTKTTSYRSINIS